MAKPEEVRGGATEEEAKDIFDAVLENRALPAQKNIVLANAAFGIQVMEKGLKSIEECVEIARESIDSGKALATFKKFVELNRDQKLGESDGLGGKSGGIGFNGGPEGGLDSCFCFSGRIGNHKVQSSRLKVQS